MNSTHIIQSKPVLSPPKDIAHESIVKLRSQLEAFRFISALSELSFQPVEFSRIQVMASKVWDLQAGHLWWSAALTEMDHAFHAYEMHHLSSSPREPRLP